jgi:hypothetical protein
VKWKLGRASVHEQKTVVGKWYLLPHTLQ